MKLWLMGLILFLGLGAIGTPASAQVVVQTGPQYHQEYHRRHYHRRYYHHHRHYYYRHHRRYYR